MSRRRHAGIREGGGRRQRLHGQQSTHVGRQQHHHVGQRKPHPQLRRELPPLVAPERHGRRPPRRLREFQHRLHRKRGGGLPARLLRSNGASVFQPGPFSHPGHGGQPLRVQLDVLRPLHPGRLEGELQAHPEPRPPLRLPQRALRDERPHGLAEPRLCAGRPPRGRRDRWSARESSMAPTTRKPGDAARRTPTGTRCSLPGSASPTVPPTSGNTVVRGGYGIFYDSAELREIDGAAGVYPYVSRTPTPRPSARRRRCGRPTSCSRASRAAEWRRPRPTASSR